MNQSRCNLCTKPYIDEHIKKNTFLWLTLGETSGFMTEEFNICHKCSGLLLWEIKTYIETKLGLRKPK